MPDLPRGRHRLSPELVAGDQRQRMLRAICVALQEHGYARTTVAQVLEIAGVSRKTFYEQFADKDECLLTAYEEAETRLWAAAESAAGSVPHLVAAEAPADPWSRRVRAVVAAVLDVLAAEPATAGLFTLEARAALPQIAARQRATLDRAAEILHAGNRARGDVSELPLGTERRLVDNVAALIGSYVLSGATEPLSGLAPQLTDHLLLPYTETGAPGAA